MNSSEMVSAGSSYEHFCARSAQVVQAGADIPSARLSYAFDDVDGFGVSLKNSTASAAAPACICRNQAGSARFGDDQRVAVARAKSRNSGAALEAAGLADRGPESEVSFLRCELSCDSAGVFASVSKNHVVIWRTSSGMRSEDLGAVASVLEPGEPVRGLPGIPRTSASVQEMAPY